MNDEIERLKAENERLKKQLKRFTELEELRKKQLVESNKKKEMAILANIIV